MSTKELDPLNRPSTEDSSQKETTFQCETCNKIYKTKATLNRHKNLHRTEYVCRTCIKCFNSSDALEEHNKNKHGDTFLCSTCGKSFGRLTSLADHNKLHFEKNEVCPYEQCGKSFTNKHLLADHMNSHTGFKPYSCEKCKKSYSTQASFCNHKAVCSRKKKCWECGKLFSTKSSLFDHRKSAHGVALYVCDCGKSYKWRTNLARHKRECATTNKDECATNKNKHNLKKS